MKIRLHNTQRVLWWQQFGFLLLPALYLVCAVLLDLVMYTGMGLPFATHYLYSLIIMLVIVALLCLTHRKWLQILCSAVLLLLQVVTCVSNIISYTSLSEIFSLETVLSLTGALTATASVDLNLAFVWPVAGIVLLYLVGVIVITSRCRQSVPRPYHFWQSLFCVGLIFISFVCYTVCYGAIPQYTPHYTQNLDNEKFFYDTFANRTQSFKMFGSYSYYLDNLLYLFGLKAEPTRILGIDLADELEPDTAGYDQVDQLGAGNNLIMILMETFEKDAINPYTMPNLYNFMQQSCTAVDGYYAIERTCFTDYISQTGINAYGTETWSVYGDVEIPFSLANIFKRANNDQYHYVANAFHNGSGRVYNRNKIFTRALGFDHFYDFHDTMSSQFTQYYNGNKDEELFKNNLTRIAPADSNFYSFVLSISTHGLSPNIDLSAQYAKEFQVIADHQQELIDFGYTGLAAVDPLQVQLTKNYLAGTVSFDLGFGALLDYLKNTTGVDGQPLLATTALVLFGDHYYYLNPTAAIPENDNPNDLIGNRCPFIIYNPHQLATDDGVTMAANALAEQPQTLGQTIERFTATMDIYKTVCSLFGIVTDTQITYGQTVFGEAASVGVGYANGYLWGEITRSDKISYWRSTDLKTFTGTTLTTAEIKAVEPLINQTFDAIFMNLKLFNTNGFKDLPKCYYTLPAA